MKMRILLLALTSALLLADSSAQAQWGRGYGGWGGGYGGGWGGGYGSGLSVGTTFGSGSTRYGVGYNTGGYGYPGGLGVGATFGSGSTRYGVGYSIPVGGYGYGNPYGGYGNGWGNSYGSSYYPSNYGGYYTSGTAVYPSSTSFYPSETSYVPGQGSVISSSYQGNCGQAVYYPSTSDGTAGSTTSFYTPDQTSNSTSTSMGLRLSDIEKDRAAKLAGLREGDIITSVGSTRTQNAEELQQALSKAKGEVEITVLTVPSMKSETIKVRPVDGKLGASVTAVAVPNR